MKDNEVTQRIIQAAIKVHTALGPGLLESTYHACLFQELTEMGLFVYSETVVPIVYGKLKLEKSYRIDLMVENRIIVEIKSVDALTPIHFAQLLTYLKLSNVRFGLLINFNVVRLKDGGLRRVVNGYGNNEST
ncbi:MAG: GxxExxY protein [Saprospiraceae bacterium]|nr:GxxExxY protein [Saprospiraceae bacterium]